MERDAFLARVRAGASGGRLPPVDYEPGPLVTEPPGGDLVNRFQANLEAVDGVVHRATATDVPATVLSILGEYEASEVLGWADEALPVDGLREHLEGRSVRWLNDRVPAPSADRIAHQGGYYELTAGITGAIAGLAESGTLVLDAGPGRSRMASLIPFVHIALLRAEDIAPSLSHWVAEHASAAADTANLILITGPSRTADIEQVLNLGVHGPKHVHVIVIA